MPLHKEIIDNSEENKLVSFLNDALKENGNGNFDIATAFFNIGAFAMIKDNWAAWQNSDCFKANLQKSTMITHSEMFCLKK